MARRSSVPPDLRRTALNERLRRLKTSTVAATLAGAMFLWWLVGGAVASTQASSTPLVPSGDSFFAQQQPSLGSGSAQVPVLRSGGS